jgi:hypothetical protein
VGYVAFTIFVGVLFSDTDRQHLFFSLGALVLLAALTASVAKEYLALPRPSPDPPAT